jgi:ABC-type transport system involved in multi-copper enzyme maturation permease subunit
VIGRIWNAFRVEWSKALRNRMSYAGPLLIMITVAAAAASPLFRGAPYGYAFVGYATSAALNHLGFVVLLGFSATLVSSDRSHGTLRLLLVRPILRHELLLGKFAMAAAYAGVLIIATALAAWGVPTALGELLGVSYGGELIYSDRSMREAYGLGMALAMLPLLAAASCSVCVSVFARSNATAVLMALGGWLTLEVIKHPLGIAPLVVTTYLETPWRVFSHHADGVPAEWLPEAAQCAGVSLGTIALSMALAAIAFRRGNLAS